MTTEIKQFAVYDSIALASSTLARVGISKDRKNQQQNYMFRGIDDVYGALAPILAESKLVIIPRFIARVASEKLSKDGRPLLYSVVEGEFDIVSAIDGSKHTARTFGEAMDSADKSTSKAMSAAYKYMAFQVFCIPTDGDNDADATTHDLAAPVPAHTVTPPARQRTPAVQPTTPIAGQPSKQPTSATQSAKPTSIDPTKWRDVPIHFGKNKGLLLGSLPINSLRWYCEEWNPNPRDDGKLSRDDGILKQATDCAYAELFQQVQQQEADAAMGSSPQEQMQEAQTKDDVPF